MTEFSAAQASVAAYLIVAGLLSLILCYLAPLIGPALGLVDDPRAKAHSLHARPTPLVGGLAVLLPSLVLAGADALLAGLSPAANAAAPSNASVSLLVVAIMLVGAIDDRLHLSARLRLAITAPMFTLFTYLIPPSVSSTSTRPPSAYLSPWVTWPRHSLPCASWHLQTP